MIYLREILFGEVYIWKLIRFCFRKLAKHNDPSRFSSSLSHEHFDSGVRMGNGAFNLV